MYVKLKLQKLLAHIIAFLLPSSIMKTKWLFPLWERKGYHITPNHFYEPIPDTRTLKNELWEKPSELVGIKMDEESQIALLTRLSSEFKEEYESFPGDAAALPYQYYVNNGKFESVDGELLYCLIRHFKPKKILEIGSGYSTYMSAHALLKNEKENGRGGELIACDPYPNEVLKSGFPGLSRLTPVKAQDIPLAEFGTLQENDILFIDSSHVLKIGSDVQYEYLEVLPRLNKGVIVHVHDIFLPAEYPKSWALQAYRFWTEQYLLQAFLSFNSAFEILWAGSCMHLHHPEKLEKAFTSYNKNTVCPGSFWMRKIR